MTDRSSTTLADYLGTLRTYWRFILALTVLAAGAAFALSSLQEETYEARATIRVTEPSQELNVLGGAASGVANPLATASTHVPQVTRTQVVEEVKRQLNTDASIDELRALVSLNVDPNSFVVVITVESSDPVTAAAVANAFAQVDAQLTTEQTRAQFAHDAENLAEQIKALNPSDNAVIQTIYTDRLSRLQSLSTIATPVALSERAQVPTSPASPKPVRNTVAAAIIGLLVAIALAFARRLLDRRLRDPAEVEEIVGHPSLGRIRKGALGHTGSAADGEAHKLGYLDPVDAEAFRRLRENVRYLSVDEEIRSIAVTSAVAQEGKSTVAACLAMASAAANMTTLLVECDLRQPVLASRFGIAPTPGLSDYLHGAVSPPEILQLVETASSGVGNGGRTSLACITAGTPATRPADILSSQRFHDFIAQVSTVYDLVVVDCPPLLPVADTLEIVPHASAVLLCIRLGRTRRDQVGLALQGLDQLPPRPLGVVVTEDPGRDKDYYGGYYAYTADQRDVYARPNEPPAESPGDLARAPAAEGTVPATQDIASSSPGTT